MALHDFAADHNISLSCPSNHRVRHIVGQAAHVLAACDVHVTAVAPPSAPPVLQDPRVLRVADQQHRMVDRLRAARVRIVIHPVAVQLKRFRAGVDRHGDGADVRDGRLHGALVARRQHVPRGDLGDGQALVELAVVLLCAGDF